MVRTQTYRRLQAELAAAREEIERRGKWAARADADSADERHRRIELEDVVLAFADDPAWPPPSPQAVERLNRLFAEAERIRRYRSSFLPTVTGATT